MCRVNTNPDVIIFACKKTCVAPTPTSGRSKTKLAQNGSGRRAACGELEYHNNGSNRLQTVFVYSCCYRLSASCVSFSLTPHTTHARTHTHTHTHPLPTVGDQAEQPQEANGSRRKRSQCERATVRHIPIIRHTC